MRRILVISLVAYVISIPRLVMAIEPPAYVGNIIERTNNGLKVNFVLYGDGTADGSGVMPNRCLRTEILSWQEVATNILSIELQLIIEDHFEVDTPGNYQTRCNYPEVIIDCLVYVGLSQTFHCQFTSDEHPQITFILRGISTVIPVQPITTPQTP